MNFTLRVLCLLFVSSYGFAALLSSEPGSVKIESVMVAKSATAHIGGKDVALSLLGAGLRAKKVIFVDVKVYVAELFAAETSGFARSSEGALASLDGAKTVALRLHFLRDVEADKIQTSFREALTVNKVDLNSAPMKAFLKSVTDSGAATKGATLTLVLQKNADGSESVSYEDASGKVTETAGGTGFAKSLLSIWLGTPSDSGVEKLKSELLKTP